MYDSYRPRRRWPRWFTLWFFGTLAVAVIGLVIGAALSPGSGRQQGPALARPAPSASAASAALSGASPTAGTGSGAVMSGAMRVVPGRELVNGVYLGFPHSTAGAVSAADAVVGEVFSTLDPDRAAAVMRLTAAPSFADAPQEAAQGAVSDRESLGIWPSGPVPAGYSLLVQPLEYQTRDVAGETVTVLLLCDFTTTVPGTGTQTRIAVFPVRMAWTQSDWKAASFSGDGDAGLAAEPFSPAAAAAGWQELLPSGSTNAA